MKSTPRRVRAVAAAIAGVTTLVVLTACSSPSSEPEDGGVDGSTITIATIAQLKDQFQTYADAYMKEFPDRKVKIEATTTDVTQYTQTLATQRLSNSLPDIFFTAGGLANNFAENDLPFDLADALESGQYGLDIDEFLPQFLDQYRPINDPEAITGLPVSADSTALAYNKTLFDEAGVTEYPQPDWTWDDYVRVATEIQTKSGGAIYGTVNPLGDGTNTICAWPILSAHGASYYDAETNTTDIGSSDSVDAWTSMIDMYGTASGPYTTAGDDPSMAITSGTVAMQIVSRGAIASIRDALADAEWDVTETPTIDGQHISGGGSYGMSVGATSKNKEAALAFLGWFYDGDGGLVVAQTPEGGGIIPPTLDGLDNGTWQDVDVPANMAVFATTGRDAELEPVLPGSASTAMTDALRTAAQEVVLNGASVADAYKTAEDTVNAALEAEKK
jgi:multiple sugar transport system substrate-binding protein